MCVSRIFFLQLFLIRLGKVSVVGGVKKESLLVEKKVRSDVDTTLLSLYT